MLLLSRAAGPFASVESESSTLSGVTKVSDTNTSGGSYLQFGAGTVTPPPPPSTGYPDATNTGYKPTGVTLQDCTATGMSSTTSPGQITKANGTVIPLSDGAVIDGCKILSNLRIYRSNITVKRSYIYEKNCGAKRTALVELMHKDGARNLVVQDSELHAEGIACTATDGTSRFIPIGFLLGSINNGKDFSCIRCNLHGGTDGIKAADNVLIQDSYIWGREDGYTPSGDTNHKDGIQNSGGGTNIKIIHNTIIGPYRDSTSAIIAQTTVGGIDNMIVENNYLSGGSYTIYLKGTSFGNPTNSAIRNNVFVKGTSGVFRVSCAEKGSGLDCDRWGYIASVSSSVSVTGNKWSDGTSITGHP